MCLLAVLFHVHPDSPLVVAANRDEWLARPAEPLQVLRREEPRVLGGRDVTAGGTWLAVNRHGVVAGLTNQPAAGGANVARRSRGELPLLLAGHARAEAAVEEFTRRVRPADYNPCWLLVGDAASLWYLTLDSGDHPGVRRLEPGIHVLENAPLGAGSPKEVGTAAGLATAAAQRGEALNRMVRALLASHELPPEPATGFRHEVKPRACDAACVHLGPYGTRAAEIIRLDPTGQAAPAVEFADGPPCRAPWRSADGLWSA
ncbi:MAG: NRDE family protein [Planctomycetes bacterium]|nr:NRDE family protein [Planctomycetota bacterium]